MVKEKGFSNESISLIFDLNTKLLIRWDAAIEMISEWKYLQLKGVPQEVYSEEVMRAISKLYYSVRNSLRVDLTDPEYIKIESAIDGSNIDDAIAAFKVIDGWLYKKGVTKFDTRAAYDRSRVEIANKYKGL
jgi:hypothetical protein